MNALPPAWTSDRLKDVAAINAASLPANTDPDYEFNYLEISNVDYHGIVDPKAIERMRYEDAPSRARRRVGKNSTVISSVRPNLQAVAFLPDGREDLICSTGFNVVHADERKLHPKFAYYALISDGARQYFEATAKGVGYPAVDDKEFNSFAVPLPPLPEQQRIAAYLDASCAAIDAAVAAKRRQLETLDEIRKSIVHHAVAKGLDETAPRRPTDSLYLPAVPAHWGVWSLKRCATILNGYAFDSTSYVEEGIPIIRIGDVAPVIDWTKVKRVSPDVLPELSRFRLERDDILVALTGATIGKSAIYRDETLALLNQRVAIFRAWRIHPEFLNYVIQTQIFTEPIDLLCYGGAQDNIGKSEVGGIKIPVPPTAEQEEIVGFLNAQTNRFNSLTSSLETQIATLTAYRKSLIHECVTGQRRITEADLAEAAHSETGPAVAHQT
jgi:type I restriction enzyme S subunit